MSKPVLQESASAKDVERQALIRKVSEANDETVDDSRVRQTQEVHLPPSRAQRGLAVAYYMAASIATQSATKAVMTSFHFNYPVTLCLAQMAFAAPVCGVLGGARVSLKQMGALLPLGLINCANIVSGLSGTGGLNVPMFIVLRRFTMPITLLLESVLYGKQHAWQVKASVGVMVAGAALAALTDLAFSLPGYLAVLANNFFTAMYLVMIKHLKAGKGLDTVQLLYCNSVISILPLLFVSVVIGEPNRIATFLNLANPLFAASLAAAVCMGLTISHSTYLCTRVNEPLTTSVAGSFKNVAMTLIGVFAFGDFHASAMNVAGIIVSMLGAVWYAYYSATAKQVKAPS